MILSLYSPLSLSFFSGVVGVRWVGVEVGVGGYSLNTRVFYGWFVVLVYGELGSFIYVHS